MLCIWRDSDQVRRGVIGCLDPSAGLRSGVIGWLDPRWGEVWLAGWTPAQGWGAVWLAGWTPGEERCDWLVGPQCRAEERCDWLVGPQRRAETRWNELHWGPSAALLWPLVKQQHLIKALQFTTHSQSPVWENTSDTNDRVWGVGEAEAALRICMNYGCGKLLPKWGTKNKSVSEIPIG